MQLGLLLTQRCNAACTHCATSCGPDKSAALSKAQIFRMMEEAAQVHDGHKLVFAISGGEPFLDFPLLVEVVEHGALLGGEVTCVTNGYWASSDEKARRMLARLKAAGLSRIAVSSSRFHQDFVKFARVQRALLLAQEAGIEAVLKYAKTRSDEARAAEAEGWAKGAGISRSEPFPVLPYLREGAALRESEYLSDPGLPEGGCPIPSVTVREDGTAYSCCAPGGFVEFLALGNAIEEGVAKVQRRFLLNGRQRLLRERGPIHFARAIEAAGGRSLLRDSYAGVCDLCSHICTDPVLSAIAAAESDQYETELVQKARDSVRSNRKAPIKQGEQTHGKQEAFGNRQGETRSRAAVQSAAQRPGSHSRNADCELHPGGHMQGAAKEES